MRLEVLGPLRVSVGGAELPVTAGRERTVLAMLGLRGGEAVPVEQLVDALWSDGPPPTARNQLQAAVSLLRRRLAKAGAGLGLIETSPAGYRLRTDRVAVDLIEFRQLVGAARAAASEGAIPSARDRYRQAIGLWRGGALAGVDSAQIRRHATALEEERAQALQECLEAELALGGGGELVAELTELVAEHPFREGLHAALMRALSHAGRPAEALAAYRRARELLRQELGTEPGRALRDLHHAILNADQPEHGGARRAALPPPRDLPAVVSCFVGRTAEVAAAQTALTARAGTRDRPPVVLLYGAGGVGKSALAIRIGHGVARQFPHGQLYVDLCGSTPGMRPLEPVEVLGQFLRRLGVRDREVPARLLEAAALFRTLTADRRMLIVLDNAADLAQVRSLLPASPSCAVLATSRSPLPALDADERVRVEVLPESDGLALLRGLAPRVAGAPQAAQEILSLSGGLPLAIRIAGGRLACRPDLSVPEYARRLADRSRRLDQLQFDDLAVRTCIRTSYESLLSDDSRESRLAARAFRSLGILHVPYASPDVLAIMLGEPEVAVARSALDRLVDAQLVEPVPDGRYRLHDLVRLVANECALAVDSETDRHQALRRAIGYYAVGLCRAQRLVLPSAVLLPDEQLAFVSDDPVAREALPVIRDPGHAKEWAGGQLPNLVAALEQAVALRDTPLSALLAYPLWSLLDSRGAWSVAHRMTTLLLRAVEDGSVTEPAAFAGLLHGRSEATLGNFAEAAAHLERAVDIFSDLGKKPWVVLSLIGLGVVSDWQAQPATALRHYRHAVELAEECGLAGFVPIISSNMSISHMLLGEFAQAKASAQLTISYGGQEASVASRASGLLNLGVAHNLCGEPASALECTSQALPLSRKMGDRVREGHALVIRAVAQLLLGSLAEAGSEAEAALAVALMIEDHHTAAAAWHVQAIAFAAGGRGEEASHARRRADEASGKLRHTRRDPALDLLLALADRLAIGAGTPHSSTAHPPLRR